MMKKLLVVFTIENYKRVYYEMGYYPPYKSCSSNVKVKLDLTNYATKTDLKNITHVDVSSFASKINLAALKTESNQQIRFNKDVFLIARQNKYQIRLYLIK